MNAVMLADKDRSLAMLAHLSGLAGYVIPVGGVIVPILLMMSLTDRPAVADVAKQALMLNIATWLVLGAAFFMWFTIVLIPIAYLIGLVATPIAVGLPIVGAIKASQGELFRYPIVGSL